MKPWVLVLLCAVLTPPRVHAWGGMHVGVTGVGAGGLYHAGGTVAAGPDGVYTGSHVLGAPAYGWGAYDPAYGGYGYWPGYPAYYTVPTYPSYTPSYSTAPVVQEYPSSYSSNFHAATVYDSGTIYAPEGVYGAW